MDIGESTITVPKLKWRWHLSPVDDEREDPGSMVTDIQQVTKAISLSRRTELCFSLRKMEQIKRNCLVRMSGAASANICV